MKVTVRAMDAGVSRGWGDDSGSDAEIHNAVCGTGDVLGPVGRTYNSLPDLARAACSAAKSGSRWWVRLDDGRLVTGYADGSGVEVKK